MKQDNILLIDKPAGWTSFDVVAKLRGQIRASYKARGETPTKRQLKVGHAGTLDPFATGLLVILLGDATKRAGEFLKLDKTYEATITLGATSTTGDPEGDIHPFQGQTLENKGKEDSLSNNFQGPTLESVERVLSQLVGEITQTPPAFSAIKIDGQRAYRLARQGKAVELPSRRVTIHSLELLDYNYPELTIRTHVSSGTYIRSLAEDIGRALGTGAYCSALRRTTIGSWDIADAKNIII